MKGAMRNNTYSYKGKSIPIARVDTSKKFRMKELDKLEFYDDLPLLLIYYDGRFYKARDSSKTIDKFLHLINRIVDPLV